jgi:hypothetical protein
MKCISCSRVRPVPTCPHKLDYYIILSQHLPQDREIGVRGAAWEGVGAGGSEQGVGEDCRKLGQGTRKVGSGEGSTERSEQERGKGRRRAAVIAAGGGTWGPGAVVESYEKGAVPGAKNLKIVRIKYKYDFIICDNE